MRILLLSETVPWPLDGGGRVKTFHTLQALSRAHEVHLHAFVRSESQRAAALEALRPLCASVTLHLLPRSLPRELAFAVRSLANGIPLTVIRHFDAGVMRLVAADCRQRAIDVAYCDHLSMLEYGRRLDVPLVHDAHNVEHLIYRRYADTLAATDPRRLVFSREARLLRAYEQEMYARCALVFAVSEVDADAIRGMAPGVAVVPVPIAVAASSLQPVTQLTPAPEVLFVGALDWPPNAQAVEWFLEEMWAGVRAAVPEAQFTVVGRGGEGLAARWRGAPGVRFTGRVEDVEPWFAQARLTVVPLRSGSGMRVKILDALARGLPVVTTTVGVEGIDTEDGRHVLVADNPEAFVRAVANVLRDADLAARLSAAGRALALERYDTRAVGALQLEALKGVAGRLGTRAQSEAVPIGDSP